MTVYVLTLIKVSSVSNVPRYQTHLGLIFVPKIRNMCFNKPDVTQISWASCYMLYGKYCEDQACYKSKENEEPGHVWWICGQSLGCQTQSMPAKAKKPVDVGRGEAMSFIPAKGAFRQTRWEMFKFRCIKDNVSQTGCSWAASVSQLNCMWRPVHAAHFDLWSTSHQKCGGKICNHSVCGHAEPQVQLKFGRKCQRWWINLEWQQWCVTRKRACMSQCF